MRNNKTNNLLFLSAGVILLYFTRGNLTFAAAAWLYPVCWLQVSRKAPKMYPLLVIPVLAGLCSQLSLRGFTHDSATNLFFYIPFAGGWLIGLLFYFDRILYSKLRGFYSTLSFPLLHTSFEFLLNLFNPFGTMGMLGYSQVEFLSFSQLASVTGMWGISFMITWFGSVVYRVLEINPDKKRMTRGILVYLSFLVPILIYGSARSSLPLKGKTVTVAGMHVFDKEREGAQIWEQLTSRHNQAFRNTSNAILKRFAAETERQAKAGAEIIVWSELSPLLLKEDEDSLLVVLRNLAKKRSIYLLAAPYTYSPGRKKSENKSLLIDPTGNIILNHLKYGGSFLEETVEGDKRITTAKTEHGRLASVICWDADFPSVVKQAGRAGTDILFIPAADWEAIYPAHSIVAIFRGIENGCSVVRQAQNGLSVMTDPRGRVITQMNHFTSAKWVMRGEVPVQGIFALYPLIGDLFGWLSLLGLLLFIKKAIAGSKYRRR